MISIDLLDLDSTKAAQNCFEHRSRSRSVSKNQTSDLWMKRVTGGELDVTRHRTREVNFKDT